MILPRKAEHPLTAKSREYRAEILKILYTAGAAHVGGALSAVDFISALYHSPIFDFSSDHFILSPGHLCLAHYVVLADFHNFSEKELLTFCQFGTRFQGHESTKVPGVEYSSGSLGQGLSYACGLAAGDKNHHTICLTTETEHDEGQVWEAVMFAHKYHLGNLINVVDYNGVQIDGFVKDIMPLGDLAAKYRQFGWTVSTIDGHNFNAIDKALNQAKKSTIYPACIILKTRFGKGVSYMENNPSYHHAKKLPDKLYFQAIDELGT